MKKMISMLLVSILCLTCFAGCGGGSDGGGSDGKTIDISLGTMFYDPAASTDLNAQGEYLQYFSDLVKERSDGRISININWASILGNSTEMLDMERTGDLGMVAGSGTSAVDPKFSVFLVPGLVDDLEMAQDLFCDPDSEMFQLAADIYAENNMVLLSGDYGEFRDLLNRKHQVRTPEDSKDIMLRVYTDDIVGAYWGGLCNTTTMSVSEIYTGLQLGTIDGIEFCAVSTISNGYVDVLKHYTDVQWQWQNSNELTINKDLFDSLSAEDQELLRGCALEASAYCCELLSKYNEEALQYMAENGIEVYHLTDAERQLWKDYADSLKGKFRDIVGAELYDKAMGIADKYRAGR